VSFSLSGKRLLLQEMTRDELADALDVFTSNPAYQKLRNGTASYSLAELEHEFDAASAIPTGIWIKLVIEHRLVGVMHVTLSTPEDPKSWISLLLLHADFQRQGLGKEAVGLVEAYCLQHGSTQIHHGIIAENEPELLFWGRLGYEQYRQVNGPVGRLIQPVILVAKWLQDSNIGR
jgi:GNAT superfamily N-acetyltransferase